MKSRASDVTSELCDNNIQGLPTDNKYSRAKLIIISATPTFLPMQSSTGMALKQKTTDGMKAYMHAVAVG